MKNIRYYVISSVLLLAATVFFSCDDDDNKGQFRSIGVKEAVYDANDNKSMKLKLKDNETLQLTPIFTPSDAPVSKITYSNRHPELLSVNESGLLTGKAPGRDTLTMRTTDGSNLEVNYIVIVVDHMVKATSIEVSAAGKNMIVPFGTTFDLAAVVTVKPDDTWDKTVVYSSKDESVATVDSKTGIVTGVTKGSTQIVITTTDGSNISTECNVTVLDQLPEFTVFYKNDKWTVSSNLGIKEGSFDALFDDKNSTFWAPTILTRPIYSPACWLDIDLGEVIKFGKLGYRHRSLNYTHLQCHTFNVEVKKSDSDEWTKIGEFVTKPLLVDSYQDFDMKNIEARFIRINFIKGHLKDGKTDWNYSEEGNVSVGDLQIYQYNR